MPNTIATAATTITRLRYRIQQLREIELDLARHLRATFCPEAASAHEDCAQMLALLLIMPDEA